MGNAEYIKEEMLKGVSSFLIYRVEEIVYQQPILMKNLPDTSV